MGGGPRRASKGDARVLRLDVTDQASIDAAAERIRHELGRLGVLVNNAGIMNAGRPGDGLEEQLNGGIRATAAAWRPASKLTG
jgi:NAD(P)-dependent dehydrogenase (short-subunit alcohol dehydrogenase family)